MISAVDFEKKRVAGGDMHDSKVFSVVGCEFCFRIYRFENIMGRYDFNGFIDQFSSLLQKISSRISSDGSD